MRALQSLVDLIIFMDATIKARKAIVAELKRRALDGDPNIKALCPENRHRWHHPQDNYYSGMGEMSCPVCESGQLGYSRSSYNGHVRACCSEPGCVNWQE